MIQYHRREIQEFFTEDAEQTLCSSVGFPLVVLCG